MGDRAPASPSPRPPRHASPPPSCLIPPTGSGRSPLSWHFRAPRSAGLALTALEGPGPTTEGSMAEGPRVPFLRVVPLGTVPLRRWKRANCRRRGRRPLLGAVAPAGGQLGRPPHQLLPTLPTSAAGPRGAKASIPGQERGAPDVAHEGVEHRGGPWHPLAPRGAPVRAAEASRRTPKKAAGCKVASQKRGGGVLGWRVRKLGSFGDRKGGAEHSPYPKRARELLQGFLGPRGEREAPARAARGRRRENSRRRTPVGELP